MTRLFIGTIFGFIYGIVSSFFVFSFILGAITTANTGILAGIGIFLVSPLYILLYIVVYFSTVLPSTVLITSFLPLVYMIFNPRSTAVRVCTSIVYLSITAFLSALSGNKMCTIIMQRELNLIEIFGSVTGTIIISIAVIILETVIISKFLKKS